MGKYASHNHKMMSSLRNTDFDWESRDYITQSALAGIVLLALGVFLLIIIPVTAISVKK